MIRLYFFKDDKLGTPWQIDNGRGTEVHKYARVELMAFGVTAMGENQTPHAWLQFDGKVIEDGAGGAIIIST